MKDVSSTQDSDSLDLALPEHTMPRADNESSDEYCQETDSFCPLAELVEQFWQPKDLFTSLKFTTPQSTPTTELTQLTDKLTISLWHSNCIQPPQPNEEPVYKNM